MPTPRYKKLFDACDTFARAANIVDALPGPPLDGQTSCRDVLPGIITREELKMIVEAADRKGRRKDS